VFQPAFVRALIKQPADTAASSSLLTSYNGSSFMSDPGGSVMCYRKLAADYTTLPIPHPMREHSVPAASDRSSYPVILIARLMK
jgi:hypothetical protein